MFLLACIVQSNLGTYEVRKRKRCVQEPYSHGLLACWTSKLFKTFMLCLQHSKKVIFIVPWSNLFHIPLFNSTWTIFVWGTKALGIMHFTVDLKQHYSVNIAPSKNTSRFQKRQLWQQKLKEMTNTTRNRK